jgi:phosphopantetheine adenylyltransferase
VINNYEIVKTGRKVMDKVVVSEENKKSISELEEEIKSKMIEWKTLMEKEMKVERLKGLTCHVFMDNDFTLTFETYE